MCGHCAEQKDRCQECEGTTYHEPTCSKMKPLKSLPPARSEFPCMVCGGEKVHARIGGNIVCHRILEKEEFPCDDCGGLRKHWANCPSHPPQNQAIGLLHSGDVKWKCPQCVEWRVEPIGKVCSRCKALAATRPTGTPTTCDLPLAERIAEAESRMQSIVDMRVH